MTKKIILFLILNFGALYLGSLFTTEGVSSNWYQELLKAPWTPPGWVFGAAWSLIMICFSIYLAYLYSLLESWKIITILFVVQWVLNVSWNPTFFYFREIVLGLVIITLLLILVHIFLFKYYKTLSWKSIFILPYAIWLWIATSLNVYIYCYNPN